MNNIQESAISLKDVWKEVYKKKWLIICISSISTILAVYIAIKLPNIYKSEVTLISNLDNKGNLSSLAKNLGGLASIAGIGLNDSSGPDKAAIGMEILKSHYFIVKFVREHGLVVPLMAAVASHSNNYELILDDDIYDVSNKKWLRDVEFPKSSEPSDFEIFETFSEIFSINQDPKTGFIYASIEFYSPSIAQEWLQLLIVDINTELRTNDKEEAEKSLVFLNRQLNNITNSAMKTTFYQLIEEQTKTLMLTEAREEYVFKTIAPATIPEKKSKPKRVLIVLAGLFFGGFIALSFILINFFIKNES